MKKVTVVVGTKKGDTIGAMVEFNYGDAPIKMNTMILWQAPVDISSLNRHEGSLVIYTSVLSANESLENMSSLRYYGGHGLS